MSNVIDLAGITDLAQFPTELLAEVPAEFVAQYNKGYSAYGIPKAIFSKNLVRVSIENPKRVFNADGEVTDVQFIIRLFGVMDAQGQLVPLSKDGRNDAGTYLRGFRSNIQSMVKWVEQGILPEADKAALTEYSQRIEDMGDEAYSTEMREDGRSNSRDRLYLTPRAGAEKSGIKFGLVLRRNPVDNSYAIGIELLGALGMQLIGQGINGAVGDIAADVTIELIENRKPITVNYNSRKASPITPRNGRAPVGAKVVSLDDGF